MEVLCTLYGKKVGAVWNVALKTTVIFIKTDPHVELGLSPLDMAVLKRTTFYLNGAQTVNLFQ
jgi:hypothetical protein